MKKTKRQPIPQKEFGFASDTFNLFQEWTNDGERMAREREEAEKACELASAAQPQLFRAKRKRATRRTRPR